MTSHIQSFCMRISVVRASPVLRIAVCILAVVVLQGCGIRQYHREMAESRSHIAATARIAQTPLGKVEYAISGSGPVVLILHGAGGGHDQGMLLSKFLGEGYTYIAPSRVGYLGTLLPTDASPVLQADQAAALLKQLGFDKVTVFAISGGALAGAQVAIRHPDMCTRLILGSPSIKIVGKPEHIAAIYKLLYYSDYRYWWLSRMFKKSVLKTMGATRSAMKLMSADEKRFYDALVQTLHPITARIAGTLNDVHNWHISPQPPLHSIRVPTLIIHSRDDKLVAYENGLYAHEKIAGSQMLSLNSGGHIWVGNIESVRAEIRRFLGEPKCK